jgi:hypothetical protein
MIVEKNRGRVKKYTSIITFKNPSHKEHSASSNKKKHCKMSLKLGAKAEN